MHIYDLRYILKIYIDLEFTAVGYNYWSSEQHESNANNAYNRNFNTTNTNGDDNYYNNKNNSNKRAVCLGR